MRLLIAKLASATTQSVSIAMNSEHDVADIATDLDNCVRLLRSSEYDLVMLVLSNGRVRTRDAIARMRREAGKVPLVVLTDSGQADATLRGSLVPERSSGPDQEPFEQDRIEHGDLEPAGAARDGFGTDTAGWGWQALGEHDAAGGQRGANAVAPTDRQVAQLSLQPETETLQLGDQPLPLSQAEYRIFATLWERRGDIIPAHDLLEAIYRDGARPTSRVLPVFLFKLRKKLRNAGLGEMIETAVGRGFTIRQAPQLLLA